MITFFCFAAFCLWIYLLFFNSRKYFSYDEFFWTNKIVFEKLHQKNNNVNLKNICVIIPARNEEKNISETLNSIIQQGLNNIRILIINDNSTDKTHSVASNLLKKKKLNIRLLKEKNYQMVGVEKYGL